MSFIDLSKKFKLYIYIYNMYTASDKFTSRKFEKKIENSEEQLSKLGKIPCTSSYLQL